MRVVAVTRERLPAAAAAMGRAFVDDPMVRWSLGADPDDRADFERRSVAYFELINTANVDAGVVWETDDGSGAAVWLPPSMSATFAVDERAERALVAQLTDDGGARYATFWDWLNTHIPAEPVWYLDQIGIDPDRQGNGAGTMLVDHGLSMADETRDPAFLETATERAVAYYRRFGFRVLAEGNAPDGGPHVWFMYRDAMP